MTGRRKREWTGIAQTEEDVVREMARCLREIAAVWLLIGSSRANRDDTSS